MNPRPFLPAILLAAQCAFAGGIPWPFITIRQTGLFAGREETLRQIVECHRRHPGACDEFWFATGARKPIPDIARECEAFARCRALCEEAGILAGYQQGLTLGHGDRPNILEKPAPGEQRFPADAYQRRADGSFLGFLCPRSPDVLAYAHDYAKTMLRVATPVSYWLDDDLRLGVAHAEGCFCDRCIAAFNAKTGGSWTRNALVARLYDKSVVQEPVRAQWIEFNAESLALYAAEVRRAADELGSDCRLGYQSVSANRLYPARDYGPLLAALSGPEGRPVGIRPGDGFYDESDPRGLVRKCLGVAREAERCRALAPRDERAVGASLPEPSGRDVSTKRPSVAAICYEEETYPRHLLQKSPGAIMTECALALASGCDSLSLYWFPSEAPMPVAEYDRFLDTLLRARPYFERLAASTRRTRLGGVARLVGPCPAPDFSLADEADFDLACAGVPVTVAEGAPCAFYLTDKSRAEGLAAGAPGCSAEGLAAGAPAPAVIDITGLGRFPTAARRAKLLDDLDAATGGLFPVRIDECRALRILPRIREDGHLDSVTLLNLSIGETGPLAVRVRRPVSCKALLQDATMAEPAPVECATGATPDEAVGALPDLGPWQIATLFFGEEPEAIVLENAALRAEIVPAWAGRLTFLGRAGGANALWANPSSATNAPTGGEGRVWRNFGGNKTWVGEMEAVWPGFQEPPSDAHWPPPAWFDAAPLEVVRANVTNVLLRSGFHTNAALGWTVALEREFTLLSDRLVLRERLIDSGRKERKAVASAAPDDPRRVWSNTQIPFTPHIAIRRCGGGRERLLRGCPAPRSRGDGSNWVDLDLSGVPQHARIDADGDALAAEIPGVGWLLVEQTAPERNLSAFATPSRAIIYTTGEAARNPFIELEFVALGSDAEQMISFCFM